MKRTHPEQIGELVERLIKDYNLEGSAAKHKAAWLWGEIVGDGVNSCTTRRYVKDGILHVWITSAPLKNELLFMREGIKESINSRLTSNFITEIIIH